MYFDFFLVFLINDFVLWLCFMMMKVFELFYIKLDLYKFELLRIFDIWFLLSFILFIISCFFLVFLWFLFVDCMDIVVLVFWVFVVWFELEILVLFLWIGFRMLILELFGYVMFFILVFNECVIDVKLFMLLILELFIKIVWVCWWLNIGILVGLFELFFFCKVLCLLNIIFLFVCLSVGDDVFWICVVFLLDDCEVDGNWVVIDLLIKCLIEMFCILFGIEWIEIEYVDSVLLLGCDG